MYCKKERKITDQEFATINENKKLRNAIATAHACCNKKGEEQFKVALYGLERLIVTEEQKQKATELKNANALLTSAKHVNDLFFVGMGMVRDEKGEISNHRIRTEFITPDKRIVFIEFSIGRFRNETGEHKYLHCTHSILRGDVTGDKEINNYKGLERSKMRLAPTPENVLSIVNKDFNCCFTEVFIDNYDCNESICQSPKKFFSETA